MQNDLPVVVIGAGPQGLAAAAHLVEREQPVLVLEAGESAASAVSEWGHVRLFSAWSELVDEAAARLLEPTGWEAPAAGFPTGTQWISSYLAPLAAALGERIRYDARVVGVSRRGRDRLVDAGRAEQPFTVHVESADGAEYRVDARAVIDASGTWSAPKPAGADGLPALGERAAAELLEYRIPDYRARTKYEGTHSVVVGSGHSAVTAVIALGRIARRDPSTEVTWVLRRGAVGNTFGGGEADELPARGQLGITAKEFVDAGLIDIVTGFRVERIDRDGDRVVLTSEDGRTLGPADHVAVLTGFRPDLSFLSELRLELDPTLQAPVRIAVEVDPNVHSCGSVAATGAKDLAHPEPGFYLVGAKSYGRAPTFLAMTGYEQVRSVVAELAGDHEAAARVELVLPDTGVCGGAGLFDSTGTAIGGSCCDLPEQPLRQIGRVPTSI
ncbi:NAD(P)-binding domain-containing protein [Herbiconiux sp. CPCC 203407]|uniref:NAD(P)-binding domain-containing protein n=1 Tax=Herbiconiux oxytropis TaxID=2970915 RepID=A0AA41XFN2_9MICO|nr:NAD(P)-binding domain-containing protein [Herbiconiux oxytropis]MCS5721818.1 NAD(P)-binding domain-containing protein [Herbiconiux oxytropis]MCS5727344.1 NAD(P)-binding domain-containing protein [Herbiconiux oxytropis]